MNDYKITFDGESWDIQDLHTHNILKGEKHPELKPGPLLQSHIIRCSWCPVTMKDVFTVKVRANSYTHVLSKYFVNGVNDDKGPIPQNDLELSRLYPELYKIVKADLKGWMGGYQDPFLSFSSSKVTITLASCGVTASIYPYCLHNIKTHPQEVQSEATV